MYRCRVCFIISLFLACLSLNANAQAKFQKSLSVSFETGPLISNGKVWADEIKNSVAYRGIDVRLGWRNLSNNYVNHLHRYPTFGLGFTSSVYYFPEIGRSQAFYGFFEIPFSHKGNQKKFQMGYFLQIGIGYNLNPYDSISNPLNQYIGSNLNAFIHFGIKADYRISDRVQFFASGGLKHYSNGSTKKPNAGINLAPVAIGIRTNFGEIQKIPSETPFYPDLEKRGFWNFALYTGFKNYDIGKSAYFRGGLGFNYLWELNYKFRIGLGTDLFYASGMADRFPEGDFNFKDKTSVAIVASGEWKLTDKLFMPMGVGIYLYRNEANQEVSGFYERIGFRYRFMDQFSAGLQIKAHKAKADFFEFTLGYTIPGKVKYTTSKR
ncbi:MAG: acyloxyacyl hydrolase [Algoriphagus sp.]|uniref:acyloxyacyl hydrolase n=1 Tax=Algoriphagus sp. TaxID=1872435 RepID=UPI002607D6F1|nr:acyloxyacyl hydrolase [Algoriphagus sp.]MDG1277892.1 acyloxyacyl hydrolase [Algoriphagus sp.]